MRWGNPIGVEEMGILRRFRSLFELTTDPPKSVETSSRKDGARPGSFRNLTIGFDWGTSCTKIVIRDPYGPNSPSFLVDFKDHGDSDISYLLPSRIYTDAQGKASLTKTRGGKSFSEIKLHLMHHADQPFPHFADGRPVELAALYVACGLRYARRWFLREYKSIYGRDEIEWEFNLGIPAASHDDEEICSVFEQVARIAWGLSLEDEITLDRAREAFRKDEKGVFDAGIPDYGVHVVPEVAAQVAGYARSSLRRPGLHVLVDVGAATLDIAGFILREDEGEDRYSILTAGVHPLGAYRLEQERVSYLSQLSQKVLATDVREEWARNMAVRSSDPMRHVPSDIREYFPEEVWGKIELTEEKNPDSSFGNACFKALYATVHELREKRDPRSRSWDQGLPIFMAGGGQHVEVYLDAVKELNKWRGRFMTVAPFRIMALPSLENLNAPDLRNEDAHRFSVAYGLGFPFDDIGTIRPPHEISDLDLEVTRSPSYNYQDTKAWM